MIIRPDAKFKNGDRIKNDSAWGNYGIVKGNHYNNITEEYYYSVQYDTDTYISNVQEENLILLKGENKATNYTLAPEDSFKIFPLENPELGVEDKNDEEKECNLENGSVGDIIWREDIGHVEIANRFECTPDYIYVHKADNHEVNGLITNKYLIEVYDSKEEKYTHFGEDSLLDFYDMLYEAILNEPNKYPDGTHIKSGRGLNILLKYKNGKPYFENSFGELLQLNDFVLNERYMQPIIKIKSKDIRDKFNCEDFEIID